MPFCLLSKILTQGILSFPLKDPSTKCGGSRYAPSASSHSDIHGKILTHDQGWPPLSPILPPPTFPLNTPRDTSPRHSQWDEHIPLYSRNLPQQQWPEHKGPCQCSGKLQHDKTPNTLHNNVNTCLNILTPTVLDTRYPTIIHTVSNHYPRVVACDSTLWDTALRQNHLFQHMWNSKNIAHNLVTM